MGCVNSDEFDFVALAFVTREDINSEEPHLYTEFVLSKEINDWLMAMNDEMHP